MLTLWNYDSLHAESLKNTLHLKTKYIKLDLKTNNTMLKWSSHMMDKHHQEGKKPKYVAAWIFHIAISTSSICSSKDTQSAGTTVRSPLAQKHQCGWA